MGNVHPIKSNPIKDATISKNRLSHIFLRNHFISLNFQIDFFLIVAGAPATMTLCQSSIFASVYIYKWHTLRIHTFSTYNFSTRIRHVDAAHIEQTTIYMYTDKIAVEFIAESTTKSRSNMITRGLPSILDYFTIKIHIINNFQIQFVMW